jgi:hypothetical protein
MAWNKFQRHALVSAVSNQLINGITKYLFEEHFVGGAIELVRWSGVPFQIGTADLLCFNGSRRALIPILPSV